MGNEILVDGRKSIIVNPNLQPAIGIFIDAKYKGMTYPLSKIHPVGFEEELGFAVLRFDREDRRVIPGKLNHIIVMASLKADNVYRATGIDYLPSSGGNFSGKIKWYTMNDPTVNVTPSADEAIKCMGSYKRELEDLAKNPDDLLKILAESMRN